MIYDFGMNNGGSLAYFLTKDRVVGVDANPAMCEVVRQKFRSEIEDGRLTVVQTAVADSEGVMPFYVHKTNPGLSQMPIPHDPDQFNLVEVPTRTPASIVQEYGEPSYIKIDVEYLDHVILENLFSGGIFPPEIAAEAHSVEVFARMVAAGYNSFTLVDGASIEDDSSGPFGEDILSRWDDANTFLYTLASDGLGWKDIHASKIIPPSPAPRYRELAARQAKSLVKAVIRSVGEKFR